MWNIWKKTRKEQITNNENFSANRIEKRYVTKLALRAEALFRIPKNYSHLMEVWNQYLSNDKTLGVLDYSAIHHFNGDDEQSNPDHPRTPRDQYRVVYIVP